MKVLLINTYDHGGAANSCMRLHLELIHHQIDSKLLLKDKQRNCPQSFLFAQKDSPRSFTKKLKSKSIRILKRLKIYPLGLKKERPEIPFLQRRPKNLEMYSLPYSNCDITKSPLYQEADVINLHWVANFIDYQSFFRKNKKPVVWTLHDMNPFVGIDHYTENYLGLDQNGRPNKRSISLEEYEINRKIKEYKKGCIKNAKNLTIVAPSQWLAHEAHKSEIFSEREIEVIPNGLDKNVFAPRDQKAAKESLNLNLDKKIILFVADSVSNHRKGFEYLEKALRNFDSEKVVLCAIGKTNNVDMENTIQLGQIKDEHLMSVAYSAADVFIIPSLMDNLPNTVLESLMCGTPVIGFPVGGIPEIVQNNFNGIVAEEVSVDALVGAIAKFLNNPDVFEREEIRKAAIQHYDASIQANKYITLFNEIKNKNRDRNFFSFLKN